ncbi:MAG: ZIP family metal transporter [Bacilli bacterium]|nr:ZIP family metal transporter [Bacilli bacterium]
MKLLGLLLALISGLFFVIGYVITSKIKNKDKLSYFAISLAFVVMLNLIIFDLIPEVIEIFKGTYFIAILLILGGLGVLKVLDCFIPAHHHEHKDEEDIHEEHNSHVYHIGIVTLISLFLHNIIEGIAIYSLATNNIKLGLFMCIGVALHNIPLGIEIAISLSKERNKKGFNKVLITALALSSLFGALLVSLFGNINELFLGIISCLTLGMIIYLAFFEFLPEIYNNRKHKEIYCGIITGVIIILLSLII